jgi:hypothetical protein
VSVRSEVKKVLRDVYDTVGELPFTLTPGKRRVLPRIVHMAGGNRLVDIPVVLIRSIWRGPARGVVLKFPDNGIRHIRGRVATEGSSPRSWARAIWQWPSNARAIEAAARVRP